LDKTAWNKAKTARLLGIDRVTLYRKIKRYSLTEDTPGFWSVARYTETMQRLRCMQHHLFLSAMNQYAAHSPLTMRYAITIWNK
jgi:hypothetical protein